MNPGLLVQHGKQNKQNILAAGYFRVITNGSLGPTK